MRRAALLAVVVFAGCGRSREPARAEYRPLVEVEASFGKLITAGNHPTPNQNGTGERVGLFQDSSGTVWGLPLAASEDGSLLACGPPQLHEAKVTGAFPAGATLIGATNTPTGWRGGTGDLELVLREPNGNLRWLAVQGAEMGEPACWAPATPGPEQRLYYYRLAP